MQGEAEVVFKQIAGLEGDPELMSKEELVAAHHGDFKIFSKMDTDADGNVTLDEWHDWRQSMTERNHRWRICAARPE